MARPTSSPSSSRDDSLPWNLIYILRGAVALVALTLVLVVFLVSRVDRSEITTYKIDKEVVATKKGVKSRTLAAIVPRAAQAWFFKIEGPVELVGQQLDTYQDFLKSIRFEDESSSPTWTLPEGWKKLPDDAPQNKQGFVKRFATLEIPGEESLELAVTNLGVPSTGVDDKYLLDNINRWRRQLKLGRIEADQISEETERFKAGDVEVIMVNLVGEKSPGGMGPPFASGDAPSAGRGDGRTEKMPEFEVPSGWKKSRGSQFSSAAFAVTDGDKQAEITVTVFQPSDLLENVNRWCRQIGANQFTQQQLDERGKKIKLGDVTGDYVKLIGPSETILGVIAIHDDQAWFIKLRGDSELAKDEREEFETFVESFRFDSADGAKNGD